jgi:hypothetical protein
MTIYDEAKRAAAAPWVRCAWAADGESPLTDGGWRYVTGDWVVDVSADGCAEIVGWPSGATRAQARRAVQRVLLRHEEEEELYS